MSVMRVLINVSVGELWDKYTILLIKRDKIDNDAKRVLVETEITALYHAITKFAYRDHPLFILLKNVNECLWNIEDNIRIKESNCEFDNEFIELARSVYFKNDERAEIKRQINDEFGSLIREVKCYSSYTQGK